MASTKPQCWKCRSYDHGLAGICGELGEEVGINQEACKRFVDREEEDA